MPHVARSLVGGVAVLAAAVVVAGGCSGGGSSADGLPWAVDFSSGNDRDGFSNPDGSESGNCRREVLDGVAVYTWESEEGQGGFTRCYPVEHFSRRHDGGWQDPVTGPWVMTGRFRAALPDPESLSGETFSLITILPSAPVDTDAGPNRWLASTTVNVVWDGALERAVLNLYHVPSQGQGDFERVRADPFPFGEWVDIRIEWDADNAIRVFQDGELIIRARKDTVQDASGDEVPLGPAELHAVHFGGYASDALTGWTIENDDLAIRPAG
jgi:hypothetical protein